jgi:hypothetical protein
VKHIDDRRNPQAEEQSLRIPRGMAHTANKKPGRLSSPGNLPKHQYISQKRSALFEPGAKYTTERQVHKGSQQFSIKGFAFAECENGA